MPQALFIPQPTHALLVYNEHLASHLNLVNYCYYYYNRFTALWILFRTAQVSQLPKR